MSNIWKKILNFDWEEYRRQRAEVTREEEIEMEKALFMFALRFLWAKIRGKRLVKLWCTLEDDVKCFDLCEQTKIVLEKEIICDVCSRRQKAGRKVSILRSLLFWDEGEDMSLIMCEECVDAYTDKDKFQEYEKKYADIFGC